MATCNEGSITSMSKTPQAGDDLFRSAATGITEDSTGTFILDVMANDGGGKAKSLYSLDNGAEIGDASAYSDLLAKDAIGSVQYSRLGAEITITAAGKVSYHITPGMNLQALAAGESVTDTFTYAIKLGNGTLSWATASVQILGLNDAPTVTALSSSVHEGDGSVTVDALSGAADVDHGAVLSVVAPSVLPEGVTYDAATHSFTLDANNPAYDSLAQGETKIVTVTYGVSDQVPGGSGGGHGDHDDDHHEGGDHDGDHHDGDHHDGDHHDAAASASSATTTNTITFTIIGTNDAPTVTAQAAAISEGAGPVSVDALAGAADVDHGAVLSVVAPGALPAGVTYDAATHSFTLDANNPAYDSLAQGETKIVTVSYGVSDGIAVTPNTVDFTVTGVNDVALIGGVHAADVTENASNPLLAAGDLTIADADAGQAHFAAQAVAGAYGSFTLDAAGHWTYSADNALAAIHDLHTGDTLTDSFTAHSSDGSADQLVTVTIHGVDETVALPPPPAVDPNDFDNAVTTTSGTGGDDIFNGVNSGAGAADHYNGLGGNDTILGNGGGDILYGGSGDDTILGGGGADTIYGGSGHDTISGGIFDDVIYGGSGNDSIVGNDGNDTIVGGLGQDVLTGGAGNDTFVFHNIYDSAPGAPDTITDFTHGVDKINLAAIDANVATGAHDAFLIGGSNPNVVAHSVTWTEVGGNTIVSADVNGDTTADMQIVLTGTGLGLDAGDFVV